jgi:3-hydroxyacyl-[acyl-carrier-protein] dehydratase
MRWMWIDRVVLLEPGTRLVAVKHVSLAEEHLHDHFASAGELPALPVMPASLIIEGMAQAAGILVGHAQNFREKVVLAKISKAELREDARPGATLRYTATVQRMDRAGASTSGLVELIEPVATGAGLPREIGAIDLMFSHLDQNMGGMQFPEHNFVFGESFKTLLRSSGVLE